MVNRREGNREKSGLLPQDKDKASGTDTIIIRHDGGGEENFPEPELKRGPEYAIRKKSLN